MLNAVLLMHDITSVPELKLCMIVSFLSCI